MISMDSFFGHVARGLIVFQAFGVSIALPQSHRFQDVPLVSRDILVPEVERELGQLLSNGSAIFGPDDPAWDDATERWNVETEPDTKVVVQPAQESDISTISCQGGSLHGSKEVHTLEKPYQLFGRLATGSADCVGFAGPALGGGHGRYQGLYGLASDNFINMNVVLADGSTIQVNQTSHDDLFWGMKGAGHNFGIVTGVESRIYPREIDTWHYHNYIWTQDKLEVLFETLNEFHKDGSTPAKMGVEFGAFAMNPSISETEAVLSWYFAYAGPAEEAEEILKPFNEIEAAAEESGDVPYPDIPRIQEMDMESGTCSSNSYVGSSASLQRYNITTERQIYQLFNETVALYPGIGAGSRVFHEGYSTEAVQAIDPDSSAYPHRDDLHLVFFTAAILEPQLREPAQQLADEIRDLWFASQPGRLPTVYSNYATGVESIESIYGYEPWRLERLLGLKAKYDPNNRFRYYVPLIPENVQNLIFMARANPVNQQDRSGTADAGVPTVLSFASIG
ncbi:hypothetical protein DL768_008403 [Monosporascus sp. mg162]|nr:hypothetical protein DL768_008403 [Monosporascus sp. mg162]